MLRQSQISALRRWLQGRPTAARQVLDLGCGDGSVLEQLAPVSTRLVGVDLDPRARKEARQRLSKSSRPARGRVSDGPRVQIIDADFTDSRQASRIAGRFDLILCLGHTWMLVIDDDTAFDVLSRMHGILERGGALVIDNFPGELWSLVESGDWQTGLGEDGSCQMILDAQRGLIALRCGQEIDEACEQFKDSDTLHRLWRVEELAALAQRAGLRAPRIDEPHHLIWFDRGGESG